MRLMVKIEVEYLRELAGIRLSERRKAKNAPKYVTPTTTAPGSSQSRTDIDAR